MITVSIGDLDYDFYPFEIDISEWVPIVYIHHDFLEVYRFFDAGGRDSRLTSHCSCIQL